jgi:hypothetical protein
MNEDDRTQTSRNRNDEKSTDFIKVRTLLTVDRRVDLTSDGLRFSQSFKDRLNDTDELVRSRIIIPINEAVGLHNWAVTFVENSNQFFSDIYAEDRNQYETIVSIISSRLIEIEIELFSYKGRISEYKEGK